MSVGVINASDEFLIFLVLAINPFKNATVKIIVLIILWKGCKGEKHPETESK